MVCQTPKEAKDNAARYTTCDEGLCLKYVRTWLEIGSREGSAIDAWEAADHRHPNDRHPPGGAPCFYRGGNYGHIELSFSDVKARGTDMTSGGKVTTQQIEWCENHWGYTYLGWSEDLNGVWIPYLKNGGGGDDGSKWDHGDAHVAKLVRKQQDSDSVARLCHRLINHNGMPASHRPPGIKRNYTEEVLEAVRYWQRNLMKPKVNGPTDGTSMSNPQANQLFGSNYNVIEK